MPTYSISVNLTGLANSVAGVQQLAMQLAALKRLQGKGAGGGGGGGTGGGGASAAMKFIAGPQQRLMEIRRQQLDAANISEPKQRSAVLYDLQRAEWLAKRAIELNDRRQGDPGALKSPGLLELFQSLNALLSGAFRGGAGGMGGVGGMMGITRILGGFAKFGPAVLVAAAGLGLLALTVGAVVTGVKSFIGAVQNAAAALAEINRAALSTGGTPMDVARFAARGMSPGSLIQMAEAFRQRITVGQGGDPMNLVAASRLGIAPQAPAFLGGEQDFVSVLEQARKGLQSISSEEERLKIARQLGLLPMLQMMQVSGNLQKELETDAALQGVLADSTRQSAFDVGAAFGRIQYNVQSLLMAFGSGAFKPITEGLTAIGNAVRDLALTINVSGLSELIGKVLRVGMIKLAEVIQTFPQWLPKVLTEIEKGIRFISTMFLAFAPIITVAFKGIGLAILGTVFKIQSAVAAVATFIDTIVNGAVAAMKGAVSGLYSIFENISKLPGLAGMKPLGTREELDKKLAGIKDPIDLDKGPLEAMRATLDGIVALTGAKIPDFITDLFKKGAQFTFGDVAGKIAKPVQASNADLANAMNKNTQALQANTYVLQQGMFGGGARARGAMPSSLRGLILSQAVDGQSIKLGAFVP